MSTPTVYHTAAGRVCEMPGRIELRGPSPDPSVPAGGVLLAVAWRVPGADTWEIRVRAGLKPPWPRLVTVTGRDNALRALAGGEL